MCEWTVCQGLNFYDAHACCKLGIMKKIFTLAALYLIGAFAMLLLAGGRAHAASLTISGGCSIDNAILSANNDADTGGCTGNGAYGDDAIIVPAGTWNVGANVASEGNLTVTGAGMGDSIIDAGDSYAGIICNNAGAGLLNLSVSGLTIQNTASSSGAFPIASGNCNLTVSDVEITDGQDDANIYFNVEQDAVTAQLNISNVYIHDTLGAGVTVIAAGGAITNQVDVEVENLTVYNANSPSNVMGGISMSAGEDQNNSSHTINARIRNSTLTDDSANYSYGIFAVAQSPSSTGSSDVMNLTLENVTVVGHAIDGMFPASGIVTGAFTGPGSTASITTTMKNVLVANNQVNSAVGNCIAFPFGGGGTESATITSLGNNIADDASCGFTSTGDQENVASIMSTLGPLQHNGGSVPTMALLTGSPAIDAGATISDITADQRGVARPQCAAFDVGAYEYDGECSAVLTNNSGNGASADPTTTLASTGENLWLYLTGIFAVIATGLGLTFVQRKR